MAERPGFATPSLFGAIKAIAEISVVLSAALFLVGWSYLYGYYRAFGLSPNELNFPLQSVFMFSLPVIRTLWFWVVFLLALVVLTVISRTRFLRLLTEPAVLFAVVAISGLVVSNYAISIGRANAARDSDLSRSVLPYVKLQGVTEDTDVGGCSFNEWNYRLLVRTGSETYVVLPLDAKIQSLAANLRVCGFPDSRISSVRIQVGAQREVR